MDGALANIFVSAMNIEHKTPFNKKPLWLALQILLVAIVYFFTARLGLHLATLNHLASPVWPATGIALFFVLLWGPRMGVGVFFGAFAANYLTNAPMVALIGISIGNTLEAVVGIWLYQRFSAANERLGSHGRLISFVAVAMFPTAIGASLGSLSLYVGNVLTIANIGPSWLTWWAGDALGALILFPIAVKIQKREFDVLNFSEGRFWRMGFTLAATALSCFFVFVIPEGAPFLFVIFLALLLATIWCSATWIYLVSVLVSVISILSTKAGLGPFAGGGLNENLLHLQLFLAGVGLTAIVLGALRREGLLKNPSLALVFGWLLTGMTFYSF
jgi:integral membrane sensor domain MASE1